MQRDAPHGGVQTIADRKWHKHLTPHQKQTSGAEWARMRATRSTSTRGSEVEGKTIEASTWLMEVERRDLKCITPRLVQASLVANARRDLKCITPRLVQASLVANARRMRFLVIENSMTRNAISASMFLGHPRCNSIPSCWVSMLRGVRFCSSLHLLSNTFGAGKPAPKIIICILYGVMISYGKCLFNYAQA